MTNDSGDALTLEIAHVLFIDVVAYSTLQMDAQHQILRELQKAVSDTPTFERALAENQLISLPTGDGMALVYFQDAEAPVRCALELSLALRARPEIRLRMGIHSGPVYRVADINANRNVAGGGINLAQRVMDCCDAGHILVSAETAKILAQISTWNECLRDLGETYVKHAVRIHLFNLCTPNAGNPELPRKLTGGVAQLRSRRNIMVGFAIAALAIATVVYLARSRLLPGAWREPFQTFAITKITDAGSLTAVAISSDGKYVLSVVRNNGMESLWLRNVATGSDTQVFPPSQSHYRSLQFSLDGDYIYFRRGEGNAPGAFYHSPIFGGTPQLDAGFPNKIGSSVSFSPDRKFLAFVGISSDGGSTLVTATSDGNEREVLRFDSQLQVLGQTPSWAPNGKAIVIATWNNSSRSSSLVEVEIANGKARTILSSSEVRFMATTWMPDGDGLLVLYSAKPANNQQIGFVSYPGGAFRPITRDTDAYSGLSLSRDGRVLATVQKEDAFTLFVMPSQEATGRNATAITPRGNTYWFSWLDETNLIVESPLGPFLVTDQGEHRTYLLKGSAYAPFQSVPC